VPRSCTVCAHEEQHLLNVALVSREPYRAISRQYGLSKDALRRHAQEHIPELLVKASKAVESAEADDLLERVESLQAHALAILDAAEDTGELRTALGAIREARGNLELMGRLTKELDERPVVNVVLIAPEVRDAIVMALAPYVEARLAVADALAPFEDGS
jgi:hypothetical protein